MAEPAQVQQVDREANPFPDEIDLHRMIKRSGARKRIDVARVVVSALATTREAYEARIAELEKALADIVKRDGERYVAWKKALQRDRDAAPEWADHTG